MADTRFLIYSQERTGSSLLVDLLNQQPGITCDGELLNSPNARRGWLLQCRQQARCTLATHTQMLWRARRAPTRAYGFKVLVYQVRRPGCWSPRSFHIRGWQILNLRRRNVWRQALSNLLANHASQWHRSDGDPAPPPPQVIPWTSLTQQLDYLAHQSALETQDLQGVPHLALTYEDDLERADGWPATLTKVRAHLGLPAAPAPTRSTLLRSHDDPLERVIPNYAELLAAAARSRYAHLVDPP